MNNSDKIFQKQYFLEIENIVFAKDCILCEDVKWMYNLDSF